MKPVPGIMLAGVLCVAIALPVLAQAARPADKSADKALITHGEYLVKDIAGCPDCHTPMDNQGKLVLKQWLRGAKLSFGPLAPFPGWADTSPNIAGLEGWDTEKAVGFMMTGLDPGGHLARPPMPQFHMSRADAESVVAYLKSLK